MTRRFTWFWIFLAAGLLAFIVLYERPARRLAAQPTRVLPGLKAENVKSLEVLPKGLKLGFRLERANGGWQLTQPVSFPAQSTNVEALLEALEDLAPSRYIGEEVLATNSASAEDLYGLSEPQATLILNQGEFRIRLGRNTAPGDELFLQVVSKEGLYVVTSDLLNLLPAVTNDWRDTALVNEHFTVFDRVTVTNDSKVFELQRGLSGHWRVTSPAIAPRDFRADNARIEEALQQLRATRITQFVSDDPKTDLEPLGLQPAELMLRLARGSNTLALLQFGKTNGAGQLYARRPEQAAVFLVPQEALDAWRVPLNGLRAPYLVSLPRLPDVIEFQTQDQFSLQAETNGAWRVVPQGFPADALLVKDLLSLLSTMPIVEFKQDFATEPLLQEDGLASPSRQCTLRWLPQPGSLETNVYTVCLQFGVTNLDRVSARRTDETSIYSVNLFDVQRLPAGSWQMRQRRIWDVAPEDVAGVRCEADGKKMELVRKKAYDWSFAPGSQGVLDTSRMLPLEATVSGLTGLFAVSWEGHGAEAVSRLGASKPERQITLLLKSGGELTLGFGGKSRSGIPYGVVTLDGEPWIFEPPALLYRDITDYLAP